MTEFRLPVPLVEDDDQQKNNEAISGFIAVIKDLVFYGAGTPEGIVTANKGAVFHRRDGGVGTCYYVHEGADATNTGWVAK